MFALTKKGTEMKQFPSVLSRMIRMQQYNSQYRICTLT